MKRTVTRWVGADWKPSHTGFDKAVSILPNKQITITYDDGEPEGRCPCAGADFDRGLCCHFDKPGGCCVCHSNQATPGRMPCLSDWHKKAEPATRDRVVEGFVGKDRVQPDQRTYYGFQTTRNGVDDMPATLVIHEPVKEPTLVEVGEALLARLDRESPFTYETTLAKSDFRAALAREKAKEPRP